MHLTEEEERAVDVVLLLIAGWEAKIADGDPDASDLSKMSEMHDVCRKINTKADALKTNLGKAMLSQLDRLMLDIVEGDGFRVSVRETRYAGIAPNRLPEAKAWIEHLAPELNIPSSANVKKALEVFRDMNPDAPTPDFLSESTSRSVTNTRR